MKKIVILITVMIIFAGVCFAATYSIKKNSSGTTTVKSPTTTTTTNMYNTYNASPYVQNNTVNSSYAGIIDIVMDFSGSMSGVVDVAKRTMANVVLQIPTNTQLGLRVFGQGGSKTKELAKVQNVQKTTNNEGKTVYKLKTGKHTSSNDGCKATKVVAPIAQANANALITGIDSVELGGATPLVYALEQAAYTDLSKYSRDVPKKIILVTDGGENCGGDPCAFAKTLMSQRRDIQIDVVLVSTYSKRFNCLATLTGGQIYNLSNIHQFSNVMRDSINNVPQGTEIPQPIDQNQNTNGQGYEFYKED